MPDDDDDRCPDCGFLACICFDDDHRDDEPDALDDCMMGPDGYCGAAGSEHCDFECPLHNTYFGLPTSLV